MVKIFHLFLQKVMQVVALLAALSGRLPRTSPPYLREVATARRSIPGGFPGEGFRPLGRVGALGVFGAKAFLLAVHVAMLAAVADLGADDPEIDGVIGPFDGGIFHNSSPISTQHIISIRLHQPKRSQSVPGVPGRHSSGWGAGG